MTQKKNIDPAQKKKLIDLAYKLITEFKQGVIPHDDPNPHDWGEYGVSLFDQYSVRLTEAYLEARREFTSLAAKTLRAKSAHEKTIRAICQRAGQAYVKQSALFDEPSWAMLDREATVLVETVLAEAGRKFVHIEPNYLIRHGASDIINLGRVQSMQTELALTHTPMSKIAKIAIEVSTHPGQSIHKDGTISLQMPGSIWVVDVAATKENVAEEAKWLVDVAISLMRLSAKNWEGIFPNIGDLEAHPTRPTNFVTPHVTIEDDTYFTGGLLTVGWYEINSRVAAELGDPDLQMKANILFDPPDRSLAHRVANGLGWMTRGRQVSDRAERLLYFFTALEALLTSSDKTAPVTQTISRHVAVILSQDVKARLGLYNQTKGLYALRSTVVHSGRREVLGQDVNSLQTYVESIFWIVLNRCDLLMSQDRFMQSLADASHGLKWEFSAQEIPKKAGRDTRNG